MTSLGAGLFSASSRELDMFLAGMLRAVGGTLSIDLHDCFLLPDEQIEVIRHTDPDRVVYKIVERQPDIHLPPTLAQPGTVWDDPTTGYRWVKRVDPVGWYRTNAHPGKNQSFRYSAPVGHKEGRPDL